MSNTDKILIIAYVKPIQQRYIMTPPTVKYEGRPDELHLLLTLAPQTQCWRTTRLFFFHNNHHGTYLTMIKVYVSVPIL